LIKNSNCIYIIEGGNIVAVLTQHLINQGLIKSSFNVLIAPWLQLVSKNVPSKPDFAFFLKFTMNLQYLGNTEIPPELSAIFETNEHVLLLDKETLAKYQGMLDVNLIPKDNWIVANDTYYAPYMTSGFNLLQTNVQSSSNSSILVRDKKIRDDVLILFSDKISPSFIENDVLKNFPPTYVLVCDKDPLRYDILIFSERLKRVNVSVDYDMFHCYHEYAYYNIGPNTWNFFSKQFGSSLYSSAPPCFQLKRAEIRLIYVNLIIYLLKLRFF
jgi:acetyl esterase/lipase